MTNTHKDRNRTWVKALRSGMYKQALGQLRRILDGEKSYCCLGVAQEIFNGFKVAGHHLPTQNCADWYGWEGISPIPHKTLLTILNDTKLKINR